MNPPAGTFLDGVVAHLEAFAADRGIPAGNVHVRLTLADSTHVVIRGLRADGPLGTYAWGMIQGIASHTADALLIREDHVTTVEFQVAPILRGPAGLDAEGSP
jgi:hypothetical protein